MADSCWSAIPSHPTSVSSPVGKGPVVCSHNATHGQEGEEAPHAPPTTTWGYTHGACLSHLPHLLRVPGLLCFWERHGGRGLFPPAHIIILTPLSRHLNIQGGT